MIPDLSAGAFLRRHQNPWGPGLRGVTGLGAGLALWFHLVWLLIVCAVVEAANWLYLPEHADPPAMARRIIAQERAFLAQPRSPKYKTLTASCCAGLVVLHVALWHYAVLLAVLGFVAMALLKLGLPKTTQR